MVRVRFAPSPTGYLHIGNARTALFNWLFARTKKGAFILRIEDTDIVRSKEDYVGRILEDLKWLGLDWDEGPDKKGPFAPYRQSERIEIYKVFADKLLKEGKAYYCYCSDEELKSRKQAALKEGLTPRYDNRCRGLSKDKIKNFKENNIKPVIRFKVPEKRIIVKDILRGEVGFDTSLVGDFVIMKSTMTPSFNFAVVCDDITMKISHVIRGEDHLSNAPRHALLFEALGAKVPEFVHMSLTTAPGGDRLSKRTGATSIEHYKEAGYLPEALINYLALLGWSPGDDKEVLSREEMIKEFKLERLSKSSEAFDPEKFNWLSGIYMRKADPDKLTEQAVPFFKKYGFIKDISLKKGQYEELRNIILAIRDHLTNLSDIKTHANIFFKEDFTIKDIEARKILKDNSSGKVLKAFIKKINNINEINGEAFNKIVKDVQKETGIKGKALYQPLRIAITGQLHGPELKLIVPILGKDSCKKRIENALKLK